MWRRGPVCACTRVCWCSRIFTYIHTITVHTCVRVYARVLAGAAESLHTYIHSAYPRALKRGGRRRRTPPTTTTIGNTSTRTQTNKAGQLTLFTKVPPPNLYIHTYTYLLNLSPRHQNYTTPHHHHHRGLPPGAATPPIYYLSLPIRGFRNNGQRWSRLEWARGIGSATLRPHLRRDTVGLRRAATPHLAR